MKKIATILIVLLSFCSATAVASQKRLVAWTVASFGREAITNFDVEKYVEQTQISDAMKAALYKQAEGDFQKYSDLKSQVIQKYFKKGASQLIYAKLMERQHNANHSKKRVAFKTSEREFYDKVEQTEDKVLKELLDTRIGIVKARQKYGQFLISQNYPHKSSESASEVYWRWYEDQKSRIKTEFYLREVKNYEAYVSLKNERYYFESPVAVHDFYNEVKEDIEQNLATKKLDNAQLYKLMSNNKKWSILIKSVTNSQLSHSTVKELSQDKLLTNSAIEAIDFALSKEDDIRSYSAKALQLKKKYQDLSILEKKSKDYLAKFIQNKNDHTSYMLSLLFKLASKISNNELNTNLHDTLLENLLTTTRAFKQDLLKSDSDSTLEKELETRLLSSIEYSSLDDLERAYAELLIFSIKFQVKKYTLTTVHPVRVHLNEYKDINLHRKVRSFLKYEWMQKEYRDFVKENLLWKIDYLTIRLDAETYLTGRDAQEFLLGKELVDSL
ncbi:hypothetical protein [Halobacteriovorax sp. HLS]|uniref:hypothetical protein n=1 Tax=Halobacteriovorax sp. HLS TaxID=2234000 RepID=UPI000FD92473|nr:hypothetical protein [Halobacteriovorax sp. HLS]